MGLALVRKLPRLGRRRPRRVTQGMDSWCRRKGRARKRSAFLRIITLMQSLTRRDGYLKKRGLDSSICLDTVSRAKTRKGEKFTGAQGTTPGQEQTYDYSGKLE